MSDVIRLKLEGRGESDRDDTIELNVDEHVSHVPMYYDLVIKGWLGVRFRVTFRMSKRSENGKRVYELYRVRKYIA